MKEEGNMIRPIHTRFMALGFVLMTLMIGSCKMQVTEPDLHELVGTWDLVNRLLYFGTSVSMADSSVELGVSVEQEQSLEFSSNNVGTSFIIGDGSDSFAEFTWTTSESELSILWEGNSEATIFEYKVEGSGLTLINLLDFPGEDNLPIWLVSEFSKRE